MLTDNSDNAADVNSLRYAIDNLASGTAASTNTINSVLTGGQTITLASQLAINEGVTITGPGAGTVALSGGNAVNVLVGTGVNASIADLTITKGGGGAGVVIENLGTLSLDNCTLSGNTATANGGALYNVSGNLSINNCTLSGNTAKSGGGAVSNSRGSVSIANSTICGNTVTNGGGGGIYDYRGFGVNHQYHHQRQRGEQFYHRRPFPRSQC